MSKSLLLKCDEKDKKISIRIHVLFIIKNSIKALLIVPACTFYPECPSTNPDAQDTTEWSY